MGKSKKPKGKVIRSEMVPFETIRQAMDEEFGEQGELQVALSAPPADKNYRKAAIQHYRRAIDGVHLHVCVMCGFGIKAILEVAHLSQDRSNNALDNLAVLCPNCHKMHDIGLIPSDVIRAMRDFAPKINWELRIKDAGKKAAETRRLKSVAAKRSASAKKAVASRKSKAEGSTQT